MINLTNNLELIVYEVEVSWWDEKRDDYCDSESEYVVCDSYDTPLDDVIDSVDEHLVDCRVQIYCARTADFTVSVAKSGKIEFDATGDIDTATGYSGSPIHEVYYNKDGEIFSPELC